MRKPVKSLPRRALRAGSDTVEKALAERKARRLLKQHLTDEQWEGYRTVGHFFVETASGRKYRVGNERRPYVEELNPPEFEHNVHFCLVWHRNDRGYPVVPSRDSKANTEPPNADLILTAVLLLRFDEEEFRRIAHPGLLINVDLSTASQTERDAWEAIEGVMEMPPHLMHPDTIPSWVIGMHSVWPRKPSL